MSGFERPIDHEERRQYVLRMRYLIQIRAEVNDLIERDVVAELDEAKLALALAKVRDLRP